MKGDQWRLCLHVIAWVAAAVFSASVLCTESRAASIGGAGPPPSSVGSGGTGPARGSSAPASPGIKPATRPVLPVEKKPIHITPELLGGITQALLKTDTIPAKDELHAAIKNAESRLHYVAEKLWYMQNFAKNCSNKTYTTEDQKQAGCVGTDTINQCSQKLFRHCFDQSSANMKKTFLDARKKMYEASDRLEKASKAYTEKLKLIPIVD